MRKDLAIKDAAKCLAKIRRLMQAYAIARPAIRFRLHVLKAKSNKADFVYAPKANANVEDAALKIVGKECALQCDFTALELNSFELHAFMPKPTAVGSKIANHGAFISVDSRPVASTRGTFKKIATAIRSSLRKADPALSNAKDPFFCLNIICPIDAYDPNIEPAKDDVIFCDESFILMMVNRLLVSFYPENANVADSAERLEDLVVPHTGQMPEATRLLSRSLQPSSVHEVVPPGAAEATDSAAQSQPPQWMSSMYGIHEEDPEFLQETMPDVVAEAEEEGRHDVSISNPWTIARVNSPIKPRNPASSGQLPSPTRSQGDTVVVHQSPVLAATPQQISALEPLTPLASPQGFTAVNGQVEDELRQNLYRLPSSVLPKSSDLISSTEPAFATSAVSLRKSRSRQPFKDQPYTPLTVESDNTWFGQPMRNAPNGARSRKRGRQQAISLFPNGDPVGSQRSLVLPATERLVDTALRPENNNDIRDFFGRSQGVPALSIRSQESRPRLVEDQRRAYTEREDLNASSPCMPRFANSHHPSTSTAHEMDALFHVHQLEIPDPGSSQPNRKRPSRDASVPAARTASRPRRHRTSDGDLHRTKSFLLPLNSIPHGFELHDLALPITTTISFIVQQVSKLDMGANTPDWGCDSADAFDALGTAITERKITQWAIKLDGLLAGLFERRDGVETRGALHEEIRRSLDAHMEEAGHASERAVVATDAPVLAVGDGRANTDGSMANTDGSTAAQACSDGSGGQEERSQGGECVAGQDGVGGDFDFDFGQFVDLDCGEARRDAQDVDERGVEAGDGFGGGIDDEMLMDM